MIAAIDNKRGIAKAGKLPWDLPRDRRYLYDNIKNQQVIMGRNTFAALNSKLIKGPNITLITHKNIQIENVNIEHDLHTYLKNLKQDVWVLGGGHIYETALQYATKLYLTQIDEDFEADKYFPKYTHLFKLIKSSPWQKDNGYRFRFEVWEPK